VLTSTVWADGLVDVPPATPVRRGDVVRYLPLQGLLA
jgi:molybdopterin molybdotransferase